MEVVDQARWDPIYKPLEQTSGAARPDFTPGESNKEFLHECKILVIGAGGLGCEILKDLALSGFVNIDVIDMDTIDVSNLNRQFLFTDKDVKQSKANVAAAFMNSRVDGVHVTSHFCKIQEKPVSFYKEFQIVIAGLDSIEARRWLNGTLVSIAIEDPNCIIPLIDGGSEGFAGQARVITPTISSCFDCQMSSLAPPTSYPMCTIASNPRLPEHCVEFAVLEFPKTHGGRKASGDNPEDVQWVLDVASKRAADHGIEGVNYKFTLGVVKNIIPAVASTNAIIAAACCNEALKIASNAFVMENYMAYSGRAEPYTNTFLYERNPRCPVCDTTPARPIRVPPAITLAEWMERLRLDPDYQFKKPSFTLPSGRPIYLKIMEHTHANLTKTIEELFPRGSSVIVSDPCLPDSRAITFIIEY